MMHVAEVGLLIGRCCSRPMHLQGAPFNKTADRS